MSSPSKVTIRAYVDPQIDNMGLQKYGIALFDGIMHEEPISCLEQNGVRRYLTGLNEFAPEVKLLPEDERLAKIKQIRKIVSEVERELASNILDTEDPDFWNKVKLLRPDNDDFWGTLTIKAGNDPVYLDPLSNAIELLKVIAIEAGGFSMIAKSLEEVRSEARPRKFYLDKLEDSASVKTELMKLRNKAGALLQQLYDKNQNKLLYVCKVIDGNSTMYKKSTPNDVMYENMGNYIAGLSIERNMKRACTQFIDACDAPMETLKIRAMIKDASFHKIISTRGDGFIHHTSTNTQLGRTPSEVLEFLKNPLHEEVLKNLTNQIETLWNK